MRNHNAFDVISVFIYFLGNTNIIMHNVLYCIIEIGNDVFEATDVVD